MTTTEPKPRGTVTHRLKTWPEFFEFVWCGRKNFEVRKNDRPKGFEYGDLLHLVEFNPETQQVTGRRITARVIYVLPGGQFGIEAGYVVLGIVQLRHADATGQWRVGL